MCGSRDVRFADLARAHCAPGARPRRVPRTVLRIVGQVVRPVRPARRPAGQDGRLDGLRRPGPGWARRGPDRWMSRHATHRARVRSSPYISQVIYARPVTPTTTSDTYLTRIGNLIRDARSTAASPRAARRPARHQPERGQPHRAGPPEPLPGDARPHRRGARLRDRRARPAAPSTCGSSAGASSPARSTSRPPRTPASPCSAPRCSTGAAPRCARSPASRRSTGSSRCSTSIGVADPLAQRRQRPRDRPARPSSTWRSIDEDAARRTRSIIMFLGPLLHRADAFELPYAGGCDLGTRTVEPHMSALRPFGLEVKADRRLLPRDGRPGRSSPTRADRAHRARRHRHRERADGRRPAPRHDRSSATPRSNYMVQDLCFFLQKLGVRIEGIGTTTLTVTGVRRHRRRRRLRPLRGPDRGDVACSPPRSSPSPTITIRAGADRVPRDRAGDCSRRWASSYDRTEEYVAAQRPHPPGRPHHPARPRCTRPLDKIHPMPFPGLNIDNLPFFARHRGRAPTARR